MKFRLWDVIENKWVEEFTITPDGLAFFEREPHSSVISDNLSMYIGICDKNGKEIYTGDIVKARLYFIDEEDESYLEHTVNVANIAYGDRWFHFDKYSVVDIDFETLEVIGHIWENDNG